MQCLHDWLKSVYFKDDPEIRYDYEYERSPNKVRVFAMHNDRSLDLAGVKAKYPLIDVYSNEDDEITKIKTR